ncbi:MAG: hypothetical protein R3C05_25400 [Pirellulaceae bacterium]
MFSRASSEAARFHQMTRGSSFPATPCLGEHRSSKFAAFAVHVMFCLCVMSLLGLPKQSIGQDSSDSKQSQTQPPAGPTITDRQKQVADSYKRLEELLIRLADVEASTHPERAALLRRAARQSSETFVLKQLEDATAALSNRQYQEALTNQSSASGNLSSLLKLLLTEDRQERIRDEKDRIKRIKQDIERRLRQQTATRARTEKGAETDTLKEEQGEIAEKTKELSEELGNEESSGDNADNQNQSESDSERKSDDADASPSENESSDEGGPQENPSDDKPSEDKPADQKAGGDKSDDDKEGDSEASEDDSSKPGDKKADDEESDGKPSGDSKKGDMTPSENQKPGDKPKNGESESQQDSKPQDGESPENQPSEGSPSQPSQQGESESQQQPKSEQSPQTPQQSAAKRLDEAQRKMRQAEKELEDAKRDGAVEKQREAEQLLRQAIEDLDRILRQLREEEKERELARLESRFRKMLEMQTVVYEQTKDLDRIPVDARDRSVDIRAGNLSFEEKKIILEADRAMLVLREEGSSVAFPEVVQQMRGDMQRISDRLSEAKIGVVTQGLEEDVLAAIEEMIAALQQAQRELEEKKDKPKPPGQSQQGQPGESPLVEPIAELRLIRTLESRIKKTTERYAKLRPDAEQGLPEDVRQLVDELSQRQLRLYRVTKDIVLKKNQ